MKNIMSKKFALPKKIVIIAISVILFFVITIFLIQKSSVTADAKNNNDIVNLNKKLKSNNELILDNKKKEVQKWSSSSQAEKEDVENKSVNLTFFGNFHKMELEQFEWAIEELLKDRNYVYKSLTKDLYFLGQVLDRKYRILRLTYTIFVAGTVISLLSFAIFFYYEA